MRRPNLLALSIVFLFFGAIFGALPILKGGLYLDTHDGDTYHLLDILLRMQAGQVPHVDFHTPLGILAFLPFSSLMEVGFSAGQAVLVGQLLVAAILLPFVVYTCWSRLKSGLGLVFGLIAVGLVLAMSFGGTSPGVSISMHYNRWGWSIAFVAIVLAFVPAKRERPVLDAVIIGCLGTVLAFLKITYFVGLAPAVLVAVAVRWRVRGIVSVVAGGALTGLAIALLQGVSVFTGYFVDLTDVVGNEVRANVGTSVPEAISGVSFLGATLLGVLSMFLIRRTDEISAGYAMPLLVPGVIYVTYQNFGNDPQWLWLFGVLLFALRPGDPDRTIAGYNLRTSMAAAGIAAFAMNAPSLVANGTSTVRHALFDTQAFVPALPDTMGKTDVFLRKDRAYTMTARVHLDRELEVWGPYADVVERPKQIGFQGTEFRYCQWGAGSKAYLERFAEDLREAGLSEESQVFLADSLTGLWMFGPFTPLEGASPWYYGGLTGVENADYVALPKCGFVARIRPLVIRELEGSDLKLKLVRDNALYALFSVEM